MTMYSYLAIFNLSGEHSKSPEENPRLIEKMASLKAIKLNSTSFFISSTLSSGNLLIEFAPLVEKGEDIYVFKIDRNDWNAYTDVETVESITQAIEESQ